MQRIEHQNQVSKTFAYKQKLQYKLDYLVSSINAKSDLLQKNHYGMQSYKIVHDMLIAYREGQMSLPDFLNAILIYRSGSRQYFKQLTTYYRDVFELELLSGQPLVTF